MGARAFYDGRGGREPGLLSTEKEGAMHHCALFKQVVTSPSGQIRMSADRTRKERDEKSQQHQGRKVHVPRLCLHIVPSSDSFVRVRCLGLWTCLSVLHRTAWYMSVAAGAPISNMAMPSTKSRFLQNRDDNMRTRGDDFSLAPRPGCTSPQCSLFIRTLADRVSSVFCTTVGPPLRLYVSEHIHLRLSRLLCFSIFLLLYVCVCFLFPVSCVFLSNAVFHCFQLCSLRLCFVCIQEQVSSISYTNEHRPRLWVEQVDEETI